MFDESVTVNTELNNFLVHIHKVPKLKYLFNKGNTQNITWCNRRDPNPKT